MIPRGVAPLPVFVNPLAGRVTAVHDALLSMGHERFDIREVPPNSLMTCVRSAVKEGATRIIIAGGDGSVRTAAECLLGTRVELAILPCGTLNHVAKDLAIPLDVNEAVRIAADGHTIAVDAALVNGRVFLNTSSVGAYVTFVRLRERLEHRVGYHAASMLAGTRLFFRLPVFRISLQLRGHWREYLTPLVFVGVNERELRAPAFGSRVPHGRTGLHVMVVRQQSGARALALALSAAARGIHAVSSTPAMDSFFADSLRIEPRTDVAALDGELVSFRPPLEYRHVPSSLRMVAP